MERNKVTDGLIKDYAGRWCKDYYRVVVDNERRADWNLALAEIKQTVEESEKDILLLHHVNLMETRNPGNTEIKRILGTWSFVSTMIHQCYRSDDRRTRAICLSQSILR